MCLKAINYPRWCTSKLCRLECGRFWTINFVASSVVEFVHDGVLCRLECGRF